MNQSMTALETYAVFMYALNVRIVEAWPYIPERRTALIKARYPVLALRLMVSHCPTRYQLDVRKIWPAIRSLLLTGYTGESFPLGLQVHFALWPSPADG